MSIGTLFTLFVVPAMYLFIGTDRSKQRAVSIDAPGAGEPRTAT